MASIGHPYYPVEARIVGYLANEYSTLALLAFFGGGCAAIVALTSMIINRVHQQLPTLERVTILWFVFSSSCAILCD